MQVYDYKDAPKSFQLVSSFRSDERCYEVHCVVGDDYSEVLLQTQRLFNDESNNLIDYDVEKDNVTGKWVGITCRDYEPNSSRADTSSE